MFENAGLVECVHGEIYNSTYSVTYEICHVIAQMIHICEDTYTHFMYLYLSIYNTYSSKLVGCLIAIFVHVNFGLTQIGKVRFPCGEWRPALGHCYLAGAGGIPGQLF